MDPWSASLVSRWVRLLVDGCTVNCCLCRDILLSLQLGRKFAHFRMVCCYQFIAPSGRPVKL